MFLWSSERACERLLSRSFAIFPFANHELNGVDQFLWQTLSANAALLALLAVQPAPAPNVAPPLGIYAELAPEGAVPPFLIFQMLSSPDRNCVGNDSRMFTRPLYLIKSLTLGSSLVPAEQIAKQIDISMLGARGNVTGENIGVLGTFREEPIRYTEVDEGVRWIHCGGRYRMFVSALT